VQTRLKSWLIGVGVTAALSPLLVLVALSLLRSPRVDAPQPQYQPRPAVPEAPPAPFAAIPHAAAPAPRPSSEGVSGQRNWPAVRRPQAGGLSVGAVATGLPIR